jgi:hypothetical protein
MHYNEEQYSWKNGYGELGNFVLGLVFYCNYVSFWKYVGEEQAFPSFMRERATTSETGIGELKQWDDNWDLLAITVFFPLSHSPANPLQAKLNHIICLPFFLGHVNITLNKVRKPSRKNIFLRLNFLNLWSTTGSKQIALKKFTILMQVLAAWVIFSGFWHFPTAIRTYQEYMQMYIYHLRTKHWCFNAVARVGKCGV